MQCFLARAWRWLTTSRYTRHLEEENERLRAERDECRRQNWGLINSLVGTSGVPLPQEVLRYAERASAEPSKPIARGKKTWHQRAAALEIQTRRGYPGQASPAPANAGAHPGTTGAKGE